MLPSNDFNESLLIVSREKRITQDTLLCHGTGGGLDKKLALNLFKTKLT